MSLFGIGKKKEPKTDANELKGGLNQRAEDFYDKFGSEIRNYGVEVEMSGKDVFVYVRDPTSSDSVGVREVTRGNNLCQIQATDTGYTMITPYGKGNTNYADADSAMAGLRDRLGKLNWKKKKK
jgi:hypothetical protein